MSRRRAGGWLSDGGVRLFVDGQPVFASPERRNPARPDRSVFPISLKKGPHEVVVALDTASGLGWGLFDTNNMPILCQITRPHLRATGYGLMNLVSISCGGVADWWFGILRDLNIPLTAIFGIFASVALVSILLVLLIKPRHFDEDIVPVPR